jgi:vacuolar-type H+-ATPase subunit E/Vma4
LALGSALLLSACGGGQRSTLVALEQEKARLQDSVDQLELEKKKLRSEHEESMSKLRSDCDDRIHEIQTQARKEVQAAEDKARSDLKTAETTSRERINTLEKENDELRAQREAVSSRYRDSENDRLRLLQELTNKERLISRLEQSLTNLENLIQTVIRKQDHLSNALEVPAPPTTVTTPNMADEQ